MAKTSLNPLLPNAAISQKMIERLGKFKEYITNKDKKDTEPVRPNIPYQDRELKDIHNSYLKAIKYVRSQNIRNRDMPKNKPVMNNYAEGGSLYSDEPVINPNNPVPLKEATITAEAPTYIKYKQKWAKENPFDINKYVEDRFNNPVGREAIERIDEKGWRKQLKQEGLRKRQQELDEATKMGLLYQRFNPQNKDDMPIADEQFEKRYGTSPHRYRYDNDPEYRNYYEQLAKKATSKIDYPSTDLRRKDAVPINSLWMYPNLTGESKAQATNFSNAVIEMALPIPLLESMGKIPSVFKAGKNLIKPSSKVLNKTDDVVKNLPKLEQIPSDFKIEDVLKNISSTERKNMEIIKKGNAYFRELDNPESLKRLKEFGDEYNIDLLNAYKKAKQRWDYGTNIGGHSKFKVKKTDKDWYGLSTTDIGYEDQLRIIDLENRFGKDSKQVKDFHKKLSQEKSINYISDVVPLDRYEKTIWHELSHDINKSIIDSSPKLQEDIKNIFIEKGTADLNKVKKGREYVAKDFYTKKDKVLKDLDNPEKLQKIGEDEFDYVTRPTETWAFLSTNLRQDLKNTGIIKNYNELLTPEKLEKAIKNGNTVFSRFEPYIKDKDAFIELFNKMTLSIAPAVLYLQSQNQNKTK